MTINKFDCLYPEFHPGWDLHGQMTLTPVFPPLLAPNPGEGEGLHCSFATQNPVVLTYKIYLNQTHTHSPTPLLSHPLYTPTIEDTTTRLP